MKLVKRRKIKFLNLFILLLVVAVLSFGVYLFIQIPVKNIIITNNKYLNDDYIIRFSGLKNYPNYYSFSTISMKNKLEKSPYIAKAKVKRRFFHTIEITVKESKPLYYRDSDKRIVFADGTAYKQDFEFVVFQIPRVLNYIPNDIYDDFLKAMDKVNDDTLSRISDISYDPNDIDKERFLLYMDDGNMVYLTITKFKMINYYNTVLEQLENRKGILYLDNGNHFQIKE